MIWLVLAPILVIGSIIWLVRAIRKRLTYREHTSVRWIEIALALLVLLFGLGFLWRGANEWLWGDPPAAVAADGNPDVSIVDALKHAAAHPVPCNKIVPANQVNKEGQVIPTDSHQSWDASVPEGKRYSGDSMSTPFPSTTDNITLFRYWEQIICTQPYIGEPTGSMLANTPLGDGQTIGEIAGIGPMNPADIKPAVVHAYDNSNTKNWSDYEDYAAKVVSVLNVAQMVGLQQNPVSAQYWHFANNGVPDTDGYHAVVINGQENLPALVLRFRNKGATCELARIGINVVGPMPERFNPEGCPSPKPATPVQTGPPNCTGNNCNTPGCTGSGCKTPPPTPTCTNPCEHKTQAPGTAPKGDPGAPATEPAKQNPQPINTGNPPDPTPGGHNGGSTTQPGNPGPPATPLPTGTATGDPGGF